MLRPPRRFGLRNPLIDLCGPRRASGHTRLRWVALVANAACAGYRYSDNAYLGELKRNTAAVAALAKARWLPGYVSRAVFAGYLRIEGGIPYGADGRKGLPD